MNWRDHITSDPTIMFGKPVIKGTRIPVDLILEKLGNGESIPQLIEVYPRATEAALYSCLLFASETVKNEVVRAQAIEYTDELFDMLSVGNQLIIAAHQRYIGPVTELIEYTNSYGVTVSNMSVLVSSTINQNYLSNGYGVTLDNVNALAEKLKLT